MGQFFCIGSRKLRVELAGDGSHLRLIDRIHGGELESAAPFQFGYGDYDFGSLADRARCTIRNEGAGKLLIRFDEIDFRVNFPGNTYRKPDPAPPLVLDFAIELADDRVIFSAAPVAGLAGEEEECRLAFPAGLLRWNSGEEAELMLPAGYGGAFRFPNAARAEFDFAPFTLPFYALCRRSAPGFAVRLHDVCDQYQRIRVNSAAPGSASIDPVWVQSEPLADRERRLEVRFTAPGDGAVEVAREYRAAVIREGRFKTLREKIAARPEVEKLVGTVVWKHNVYSQRETPPGVEKSWSFYRKAVDRDSIEGKPINWNAYELFDRAKACGFDRVAVYNTGWNWGGYDTGFPRRLPPNPERGTPEEFAAAACYARSLSPDYIYSVHDNYRDVYLKSPEFDESELFRDRDGVAIRGGLWRGGRARLLCGKCALRYAKRDLPKIAEMVGKGGIYIDVIGGTIPRACYDPRHPMSRPEDLACRRELMQFAAETMGSLATEYAPSDFCADLCDLGAFARIAPNPAPLLGAFFPYPLWQLVYHDSVLNYTAEEFCGYNGPRYLAMQALYNLLPTQFDAGSRRLSFELRSAFTSELVDFRWLAETGVPAAPGAALARYADGTTVVANAAESPFAFEGRNIEPDSFLILKEK